jgi:hypothetical protein
LAESPPAGKREDRLDRLAEASPDVGNLASDEA